MVKQIFSMASFGGLVLLLGGCNVGSDQSQPNTSGGTQPAATTTVQSQLLSTALTPTAKPTALATIPAHTDTYYLVLHGVNAAGERIGYSIDFQKNVANTGNPAVQLIWFEPNRKADGTCLQDLSGYDLEYGLQATDLNTTLKFDLASRDMTCTTVGTTECGDVRECRYNLAL